MFGNDTTDNQSTTTAMSGSDLVSQNAPVLGLGSMPQNTTGAPSITGDSIISSNDTTSMEQSLPNTQNDIPAFIPPAPIETPAEKLSDDLMELKKDALAKLGPLVDKLEQTPAEKFKTTMMMIQASDDKALLPKAYEAANEIEDEKVKAQALLDIINEINYFTAQVNTASSI